MKKHKIPAKERLLQSAELLFAERGYGNVGINEIIAHADTAKASFYQHFPSKDDLCAAWLQSIHERAVQRHEALLVEDEDPFGLLIAYFRNLAHSVSDQQMRGCPFTNTAAFIGVNSEAVWQVIAQHKRYHRDFFQRLAAQLPLRELDAASLGNLLFLLYSGAAAESQNARSVTPIDDAIHVLHSLTGTVVST